MKKTVWIILFLLLLSLTVPAAAQELPDWYPEDPLSFERFFDPDAPRVVDYADILTDSEERTVAALLSTLREKYDCDFVFYSDVTSYGMGHELWSADYYDFNGYGVGEDHNGCILFVCMDPMDRGWWTCSTGDCRKYFTYEAVNRVDDRLEPYMVAGEYGDGIIDYFESMDTLFRTGKAPRRAEDILRPAAVSAVIGLIAAFIARAILKGKMKTVREAHQAGAYQVPGSVVVRNAQDIFLRKTVNRTKRDSSRSGGSGGGSTHIGGYHSSGGVSHTGGGRKF